RTVTQAQRRPDALAGASAVCDPAVTQLLDVRLIGGLVIGGIEFRLRVVQINERLALRLCGGHVSGAGLLRAEKRSVFRRLRQPEFRRGGLSRNPIDRVSRRGIASVPGQW